VLDPGAFDDGRYFDVIASYAKSTPAHTLIRLTVANRGPAAATLHLLAPRWFRNLWTWGCEREHVAVKPPRSLHGAGTVPAQPESLGDFSLHLAPASDGTVPTALFPENDPNHRRLSGSPNASPFVKDAFHRSVVHGETAAVNPAQTGTKAALHDVLTVPPGGKITVDLRS